MRHGDNVLPVDSTRVGEYYLAYDDDAARASDVVAGFCYRKGLSISDVES